MDDVPNRLIEFDSGGLPVVSLYLMRRRTSTGATSLIASSAGSSRARAKTFEPRMPEGESFRRDAERIEQFLRKKCARRQAAVAIFACAGKDEFFLPVQVTCRSTATSYSSSTRRIFTRSRG